MRISFMLAAAAVPLLAGGLSSDGKAVHAVNRITFGAQPGDADQVRKLGVNKWIDRQLHPERIPEDPGLAAKLAPLDTLNMKSFEMVRRYPPPQVVRAFAAGRLPAPRDPAERALLEKLAARLPERQQAKKDGKPAANPAKLARMTDPERRAALMETAPQQVVAQDLQEAKLYRAIYSRRQLDEMLVDFWFNHFNVFENKGADQVLLTSYERDAIRPYVLNHFKDLLLATAEHPAMLFYLDNWQSRAGKINENYGRELLELHSLGVDGGYTQRDVIEVARCFTGWTIQRPQQGGEFEFNPRMHDTGEKTVLGVKIPAGGGIEDGLKVIDILARHPSTARFISRELAVRFVADNPPRTLVERMAKRFRQTDGDLREVLKTMFKSKEFWDRSAAGAKFKTPLEFVASAVRASGAQVDSALPLAFWVAKMGEPLYRKLEPTGYYWTNSEWINSGALVARMNFAAALAENRIQGVRVEPGAVNAEVIGGPEFQKR